MSRDQETRSERRANFEKMATADFKEHVLVQEADDRWYCGKPGTGIYSFRVLTPPGAVIVYGDIGEMILRPSDRNSLAWLRSAPHLDYVLGKDPHQQKRRVFLMAEAEEHLQEMRDEGRGTMADLILEELSDEVDMDESEDALREWHRAYYVATGDSEPPECADWEPEMLWCWHGLQCFVRLFEATMAGTTESAP